MGYIDICNIPQRAQGAWHSSLCKSVHRWGAKTACTSLAHHILSRTEGALTAKPCTGGHDARGVQGGTCTRTVSSMAGRLSCCDSCSCWYQWLDLTSPITPRPYSSLRMRRILLWQPLVQVLT